MPQKYMKARRFPGSPIKVQKIRKVPMDISAAELMAGVAVAVV